ncbi:MAG TPA: hypothetical protein VNU70_10315 [Puia sp.]|jgi:hypothetical protein|nr:hypothetical protein [Puia sp.]
MIGIVRTGRTFRQNLGYCLKDKLTLAKEGTERQVVYKNRAEIIHFSQC